MGQVCPSFPGMRLLNGMWLPLCRSIEELQEQNQKLLAVVRELSSEQEMQETETRDTKYVTHTHIVFELIDFTRRCKLLALSCHCVTCCQRLLGAFAVVCGIALC